MNRPRALVVDDEPQMLGIVAYALDTQGFEVAVAYDGEQALQKLESTRPDLIVLDVMLPKLSGFEVCRQVRENTTIPVILLTAKDEDEDVLQGLELGADDYITKPFNPREVALRAQAVVRRCGWGHTDTMIHIGGLAVDAGAHRASLEGQPLHLTHNELRLLESLAANAGRVLSWQSLLKAAWDAESWEGGREMVKTAVYRLRQKIEAEPDCPRYILTVRGIGYTMPI